MCDVEMQHSRQVSSQKFYFLRELSERVIPGEGERNGILEAGGPGQEGEDQVLLDDDEGSPWDTHAAADLERSSQD